MKLTSNLMTYDWTTWLVGIMRSFISGGAGAVAGAIGPMATDPKDWNLGEGLPHVLQSMAVSFIVVGIVHMMIFLQTHGTPEQLNLTKGDQ